MSASSCAWTACRSRRDSWDGVLAATTARAGYFAPFSNEAVGPLGALAACRDRDAVERRLGGARGLPGLRTPRVSAEGTLAGRPLVVFVALAPAAWLRRRTRGGGLDGDHAPGSLLDEAGATGRHAWEGHRPRVREVTGRQRDIFGRLGYGVADHVITLREFRGTQVRSDPRPSGADRRVAMIFRSWRAAPAVPSKPLAAHRSPRPPPGGLGP